MKILCINAGNILIPKKDSKEHYTCIGTGLEEGKIYETQGNPFLSDNVEEPCYFIQGIGRRLCCRFTTLIDEPSEEDVAFQRLKKELNIN